MSVFSVFIEQQCFVFTFIGVRILDESVSSKKLSKLALVYSVVRTVPGGRVGTGGTRYEPIKVKYQ